MPAASARRWHHPSPTAPRSARAAWSSGVSTPGKNRPLGGISTSTLTHGTPSGTQPVVSQRGSAIPAGMSLWAVQYGFTGYIADQETGLLHARARMYSPIGGRFINRDPMGYLDGWNLYEGYFVPGKVDPKGTNLVVDSTFRLYGRTIDNGRTTYSSGRFSRQNFDQEVRDALQSIVGDCATVTANRHWDSFLQRPWNPFSSAQPTRQDYFRSSVIGYINERPGCRCNPCWQILKAAIDQPATAGQITIQYIANTLPGTTYPEGTVNPTFPTINIDPANTAGVNYHSPDGASHPAEFAPVLWHEAIGHGWQQLGHPAHVDNDPTVFSENMARYCMNLNVPGSVMWRHPQDPNILEGYHPAHRPGARMTAGP